jgi:hypothetical protein
MRRLLAVVAVTLGVVIGLVIVEVSAWLLRPPPPPQRRVTPFYYENDPVLGWRLKPGVYKDVETIEGHLVHDVTYHIGADHRRPSPPGSGCVWFFGCSFTFGQGVEDAQTLPYRLGVQTGQRTINFATSAYGAQHMLAALEHGLEPPCRPTHVVYQAITSHVGRASGLQSYAKAGPRYRLADGRALYVETVPRPLPDAGGLWPGSTGLWAELRYQLAKSNLYSLIASYQPRSSPAELPLYVAIVRQARERLLADYPAAEFHVLLWDHPEFFRGDAGLVWQELRRLTPHAHRVSSILPDYATARVQYQLHERNRHPNARAHDLLAAYLADQLR